ncbi:MAG: ATP phosphoribosyltransferase [Clostridia bacterium]|nr:MAG: ATP phosphoribosyltransferase [Clostridia bacterium]
MLTIALPKGRMAQDALQWLSRAGWPQPVPEDDRKLVISSLDGSLNYLLVKPMDVPIFVEQGAADMGIAGLDAIRERSSDVYEPLLLPFGYCRLSIAGPANRPRHPLRLDISPRVATKYPRLAEKYFREQGISAEYIYMNGSVELGPLVGLADLIVDIIQTGSTLKANNLIELYQIMPSQAALIVNRASYRLHAQRIQPLLAALQRILPD